MREIKFRALTGNGNWVYGHYFYDPVHEVHQIIAKDGVFYTVREGTVSEFTGLKDKNGKEIYEGDIVRLPDESLCDVRFSAGAFCLADKNSPAFHFLRSTLGGYCWKGEFKGEVIGNIYESPELLTQEA